MKNLALAGVGHLSILGCDDNIPHQKSTQSNGDYNGEEFDDILGDLDEMIKGIDEEEREWEEENSVKSRGPIARLIGSSKDLVSYARDLNPYVNAHTVPSQSILSPEILDAGYSAVILVDSDFEMCTAFSKHCRAIKSSRDKPKLVVCGVQGVCGYIMNDFGESHRIEDADGEEMKEIPLLYISVLDNDGTMLRMQVYCIIKHLSSILLSVYRSKCTCSLVI